MICAACGCVQGEGVHFCKQCGRRMDGVPPASSGQQPWMPLTSYPGYPAAYMQLVEARRERVRQNLQPLGIVWCMWGVYRLLLGAAAGFALHTWSQHRWFFGDAGEYYPHFFTGFVPVIAVTTVAMASLAVLTGYGLLTMKPWARTLALVMSILTLIKIPLGTALGIYTLWVLGPRVSRMEYDALVRQTPPGVYQVKIFKRSDLASIDDLVKPRFALLSQGSIAMNVHGVQTTRRAGEAVLSSSRP